MNHQRKTIEYELVDRLNKKILNLEEQARRYNLGMEVMISLANFHRDLKQPRDPAQMYRTTLHYLKMLLPLKVSGFYVLSPESMEFTISECDPPEEASLLQQEVDLQIEKGNFAWALRQNRFLLVDIKPAGGKAVLHSLVSKSRVHGMFVGILNRNFRLNHERQVLVSNILSHLVTAVENVELYQMLNMQNKSLSDVLQNQTEELEKKSRILLMEINEKKRMQNRINSLSFYDSVTHLPNRAMTVDRLKIAMAQANRTKKAVAVLFLGLLDFKPILGSLGHGAADVFLKELARHIIQNVREEDTVGHTGKDEFVILLSGLENKELARQVITNITGKISNPIDIYQKKIFPKFSVGIACYPFDGTDPETLLTKADGAMDYGKSSGKGGIQFYNAGEHSKGKQKVTMELALREGLDRGEFFLVYQPKMNILTNRISGMEALLRWNNPKLGTVPPGLFIPVADETMLILSIGDWVLRSACLQIKKWMDQDLRDFRVAVNLSGNQCNHVQLVDWVRSMIEETGIDPAHLELEFTETVLMENLDQMGPQLETLKAMGVHLSIDDFGMGYSSLSYLRNLPIQTLKIDQSFIHNVTEEINIANARITEAIILLAKSLGLATVAEGVENKEEFDFLHALGCDSLQGFYFQKPMAVDQVSALLETCRNG